MSNVMFSLCVKLASTSRIEQTTYFEQKYSTFTTMALVLVYAYKYLRNSIAKRMTASAHAKVPKDDKFMRRV